MPFSVQKYPRPNIRCVESAVGATSGIYFTCTSLNPLRGLKSLGFLMVRSMFALLITTDTC